MTYHVLASVAAASGLGWLLRALILLATLAAPALWAQPAAPGAPTDLKAVEGGPNGISLSWKAPAHSGAAAISGYKIEVSPDGTTWTVLVRNTESDRTSYTHLSLASDTSQVYRVSAINSFGEGSPSSVASVVTSGAPALEAATEGGATLADPSIATGATVPTNVVLIMADDLGYETIAANGGTSYTTPNLDRMAREGMRFTHAYSQPSCTPSRVKLMTGKYNWRNYGRFGYLEQGERTFAHLMKQAGYATAMTGKWQLSGPATEKRPGGMKPGEAGFDEHMYHAQEQDLSAEDLRHYLSVGRPRDGPTLSYWHPAILKNGSYLPTSMDDYGPDMFADFAIEFIKSNKNGPFFLYYPMILAHTPWVATPDSATRTQRTKFGSGHARQFPNSVAYADHLVGRLLKALDDLGIGDDTLVLFTADNGTSRYIESRMGQRVSRGGKGRTTEAGTHVPLLARWKGTVAPGSVNNNLIDFSDFYATMADLTGQRPADEVDGRSFLSQLRGQASIPRDWLFMHFAKANLSADQDGRPAPVRFSRTKRYKLYSDGRFFDVTSDREEQAPLASLTPAATAVRSMLQGVLDSMPPTVSARPTDLRAVPGPNSIKLSWKAPANTGGTPITGYKIEVSLQPTGHRWRTLVANTGSAKTTYDHVGLTRNRSRRYRVRAINSVGTSRRSNVAVATAGALPPMTLSLEPSSVGEGAGLTAVTVTASLGSTSRTEATQVSVSVTPGGGGSATAGTDYREVSGFTVTIPAGQTSGSAQLNFQPIGDAIAEGDETVVLSASATGFAAGTATLTITDDNAALPAISILDAAGGEGSSAIAFTVKLAPASSGEVTVDYATSGGSATEGTDYTASSGTLRFAPGDTEKNVAVTVADDGADENDETFEVTLDKATNARIADGSARGMITDNDGKPNVLFISIDDLNDWIEPLGGHPQAKTPNLTRLAKRSTLFSRAYGASPVCNPSRVALLTGIAPYRSGVLANATRFRTVMPDAVTLPHAFRKSGYWAGGLGKIFHHPDDGASWDAPRSSFNRKRNRPADPQKRFVWKDRVYEQAENNIEWGPLENDAAETSDGTVVKWVSDQLGNPHGKPFFLGAGIYQPHPPWFVPKKYFDRFPLETVQLPSVKSDDLADLPSGGIKTARRRKDHETITANGQWRKAVQAYLAALNFADEMLGLLLDALEESGRADNTIVVVWGDHGWHHGQKEHWRKHALWEQATRTPLMIYAPRGTPGLPEGTRAGTVSSRPVSLLDLYPTLLELAGLEPRRDLDGSSLVPLLRDPARRWHPAIMTHADRNGVHHAARTDDYRYIRYSDGSEELYDHRKDPLEWTNLASNPDYRDEKERLARYLQRTTAPERLTVNPEALTIAEGSSGTYTVALTQKPKGPVTVTVGGAAGDVTVKPSSLSFTMSNWETEQTVTVSAAVDADTTADPPTTLTHSGAYTQGQDGVVSGPDVVVTVTESKPVARALSVQFGAAAYTATEGGTSAVVTVSLSADPERTVTVPLSQSPLNGAEAADYSGVPSSVTFSKAETSQTFTVSATDDSEDDDGEAVELGFGSLPTGVTAGGQSTATVNLVDDDVTPVLSLSPQTQSGVEGESLAFAVRLSAASGREVTVAYATTDGTAKAGEDYTAASGTLTFRPGETAKTVEVATIQDELAEEDETFTLALTDPSNAVAPAVGGTATGTIRDDDELPRLRVSPASLSGEEGESLAFSVELLAATSREVTVAYATADGTAKAGADYTAASGTLTFRPGETEKAVEVATTQDELDEEDETFTLALGAATNAKVRPGRRSSSATIRDDDVRPRLRVSPASLNGEEGESLVFSVELLAASGREVTVDYATADGTAKAGEDYEAASGTLTFSPGETAKTVEVATIQDKSAEEDETFTLALGAATNAKVRPGGQSATGTIRDDDELPRLRVSPASLSGAEGESLVFSVELSAASSREVTVEYATEDGTAKAGADYTAASGTLTFRPGETEKAVEVATIQDELDEEDETFTLALTNPSNAVAPAAGGAATGTIRDDDELPRLRASPASLSGGEGESLVFSVELLAASSREVTVEYATEDGTAKAGADYTAASGTLTFRPGETEKTVEVATTQDELDEEDETFTLALGAATNAKVRPGRQSATGTILDDDARPRLKVEPGNLRRKEGKRFKFSVELSAASGRQVTVDYATEDGTAKAGEDYTAASGTLTFRPGETAQTVMVATIQDKSEEEDETFTLSLGAATNAKVRPNRRSATVTIRDDDGSAGDQRESPAGIAIWTDELGYRPGERLRLYRAMDPKGDENDYTVFFYREDIETGERSYLAPAIRPAALWEEAVDQHGRGERDFWVGPVEAIQQELIWEGTVPAPGLWHFVAEMRGPEARTVLKRAHAKFVVARRSEALNGVGVERSVADELTLRRDTLYSLQDRLVVKPGATLAIEAGTLVRARGPRAEIVVEPGGRIEVQGRQDAPVVMTCAAPVGRRQPGCWGGLRVFGLAPVEQREAFGGDDPHDSSGSLRYLRVEFAGGGPAGTALALDGVGDGTRIEHVQAHASLGDGIAFRGGTAECAYCVASEARKDALAWAQGWQGKARHVYVQQGPVGGSAIRASGPGWGPAEAVPSLSNVTLVGAFSADQQPARLTQRLQSGKPAIRLEDGAALAARNTVVVGFRGPAIDAGIGAVAHFVAGRSSFTHSILYANQPSKNPRAQVADGISAYVEYLDDDPDLLNVRYEPNPDPRPNYGSAALRPTSVAVPTRGVELSPAPQYVGAFGGRNWLEEWTFFGAERDYDPAVESGHR